VRAHWVDWFWPVRRELDAFRFEYFPICRGDRRRGQLDKSGIKHVDTDPGTKSEILPTVDVEDSYEEVAPPKHQTSEEVQVKTFAIKLALVVAASGISCWASIIDDPLVLRTCGDPVHR
jgi:hypothetical protein